MYRLHFGRPGLRLVCQTASVVWWKPFRVLQPFLVPQPCLPLVVVVGAARLLPLSAAVSAPFLDLRVVLPRAVSDVLRSLPLLCVSPPLLLLFWHLPLPFWPLLVLSVLWRVRIDKPNASCLHKPSSIRLSSASSSRLILSSSSWRSFSSSHALVTVFLLFSFSSSIFFRAASFRLANSSPFFANNTSLRVWYSSVIRARRALVARSCW